jgi:hypothetical protein
MKQIHDLMKRSAFEKLLFLGYKNREHPQLVNYLKNQGSEMKN